MVCPSATLKALTLWDIRAGLLLDALFAIEDLMLLKNLSTFVLNARISIERFSVKLMLED